MVWVFRLGNSSASFQKSSAQVTLSKKYQMVRDLVYILYKKPSKHLKDGSVLFHLKIWVLPLQL